MMNELKELESSITYYQNSECARLAALYDIPLVGGHILWCQQKKNRLDSLLKKVEVLLGKDWDKLNEGRRISVCVVDGDCRLVLRDRT